MQTQNSILNNNFILEDVRGAIDSMLVLFRRNYFKNNNDFKRIKRNRDEEQESCEKYLAASGFNINPSTSITNKKLTVGVGLQKIKTTTPSYQLCRMNADKQYYVDLLSLLRKSKNKMCEGVTDQSKCKKSIEDRIEDAESNLRKISYASQYLK